MSIALLNTERKHTPTRTQLKQRSKSMHLLSSCFMHFTLNYFRIFKPDKCPVCPGKTKLNAHKKIPSTLLMFLYVERNGMRMSFNIVVVVAKSRCSIRFWYGSFFFSQRSFIATILFVWINASEMSCRYTNIDDAIFLLPNLWLSRSRTLYGWIQRCLYHCQCICVS